MSILGERVRLPSFDPDGYRAAPMDGWTRRAGTVVAKTRGIDDKVWYRVDLDEDYPAEFTPWDLRSPADDQRSRRRLLVGTYRLLAWRDKIDPIAEILAQNGGVAAFATGVHGDPSDLPTFGPKEGDRLRDKGFFTLSCSIRIRLEDRSYLKD